MNAVLASGPSGTDLTVIDGEPRVRDADLARWLEFKEPRAIRKLIERWTKKGAITPYSRDTVSRQSTGNGASREFAVTVYWLTKAEAIFVTVKSETPRAVELTNYIVEVFLSVSAPKPPAPPALPAPELSALSRFCLDASRPAANAGDAKLALAVLTLSLLANEDPDRADVQEQLLAVQRELARLASAQATHCAKVIGHWSSTVLAASQVEELGALILRGARLRTWTDPSPAPEALD